MDSKSQPPTHGEALFERYLNENGLESSSWSASPGGKNPDRLVTSNEGEVLCEIKDFGAGDLDKLLIENAEQGRPSAGAWDPPCRTRNRIWKVVEKGQLAVAEGRLPTMVILHNPGFMPSEWHMFMLDALFGRQQICQMVGPEGAVGPAWLERADRTDPAAKAKPYGLFNRQETAHISAVAVLEQVKPNIHLLRTAQQPVHDKTYAEYESEGAGRRGHRPFSELGKHIVEACTELDRIRQELELQLGEGYLDKTICRLRVYHNHRASQPLPLQSFAGECDVQFYLDSDKLAAVGDERFEVELA